MPSPADLETRPIEARPSTGATKQAAKADEHEPDAKAEDEHDDDDQEPSRGDLVGRYTVLGRLGRGGMGEVYKAYDPQLDRNVAIKLMRRRHRSMDADLRLLREAQTLAKLKHPNVVAVYDAGLASRGVFIAMELLEGKPLDAWITQRRRSVHELLEVFRAAGRGLVAAHEAGFVHRDFKPSNVFVGEDGLVRVLDFGLAHNVAAHGPPAGSPTAPIKPRPRIERPEEAGLPLSEPATWESFSTEAGTVMGTPAFMAPELLADGRSDHRSEQFSFAMSLYVSLYERAPLGGRTYEERRQSLERGMPLADGELEISASGERVPARVRRVIRRGLATVPTERFGSMSELLAELELPRRRWGGVATGLTLLAGVGVGATIFSGGEPPCSDPTAALAGAWGPEARARLEGTMQRAGFEALLPRVTSRLDEYADTWVAMYDESCRATFVDHHQSELSFDQRLRCLERRRNRLRATVDALVGAADGPQLVQRTILAWQLPPLQECADLEAVATETLPDDPTLRTRIASLRERIDEADTRHDAGDFAGGLALAREATDEARALGYAPAYAEALVSLGRLQTAVGEAEAAEATLAEALELAATVGDDRRVATVWTWLVFARARAEHDGETEVLALAARTAVERAGDPTIRGWLLNNLGVLDGALGRLDAAVEHLRAALAVKLELLGEDHVDVGISRFNLGNALVERGAWAEARPELVRAREIFESTVGERHPMTHYALKGLCRSELGAGRAEAAIGPCEAALAGFEAAPVRWTAGVELLLARALWSAEQRPRALTVARSAREHAQGQDEELVAEVDTWLADPDGFVGPP